MIEEIERCARCGFCEAVCPTYNAFKIRHMGPRGRLQMALLVYTDGKPSKYVVESIETCLRCRACELVCPASIRIVDVITQARRILHGRAQKVPR
ncbi:MAG: (Fe-S)-binding protein [Thermoproteus sp.]